jgi:hypothetical protein
MAPRYQLSLVENRHTKAGLSANKCYYVKPKAQKQLVQGRRLSVPLRSTWGTREGLVGNRTQRLEPPDLSSVSSPTNVPRF